MAVDVSKGRGQDYSTFTVFDVTSRPFKQVCTYRNNMISPLLFPDLIVWTAKLYNNCIVLIESNDVGQVVCNGVYYDLEYENTFVESSIKSDGIGVTMNKKIKRIGCSNLKDIIEQNILEVYDVDTIQELSSFVPKGSSYEADKGAHDDMVMNCVMFGWFVSNTAFGDVDQINLKEMLYQDRQLTEDDMLDFGYIKSDGQSDEYQDMVDQVRTWKDL
jgi:hypothetical protein